MENTKFPLWRRILIGLLLMVELAFLVTLINIDNIIDYNLESVTDDVDNYVDEHFGFTVLTEREYHKFINNNNELIAIHGYSRVFIENLYYNKLYIKEFGKKAFDESVYKYGDNAHYYRQAKLRKKAYAQLYPIWEKEYCKYRELFQEESHKRINARIICFSFILICGLGIYLSSYRKINRNNRQAYHFAVYCVLCEVLSIIIASFGLKIVNFSYDTLSLWHWLLLFSSSVVILPVILTYLYKRANGVKKQSHILIPLWLKKTNMANSELSKRLFLVFISYPLFCIVPIPYVGIFAFIFYIIPMVIIFAIINILLWIVKGRKMDKKLQALKYDNSKAKIYCRFCGKIIDADSGYCRYCGKEL